jgi:hypothetical protein
MSDERMPAHLQSLWQDQPVESVPMSPDELRNRSRRLSRVVSRRNLREYVAGAAVMILCGYLAWKAPLLPLMRAGFALSVPSVIVIIYHLHRYGAVMTMPEEMGLTGCLQFHRGELERQRDLLNNVWKWYLLPLMPGLILVCLAPALARPETAWRALGLYVGIMVLFWWIVEANRYAAKRLQARIDALESDT